MESCSKCSNFDEHQGYLVCTDCGTVNSVQDFVYPENSDENSGSYDEDVTSASKQKQYPASLKAKYSELEAKYSEFHELLNFDESSSDEDSAEDDGLDPVHKLPNNLEIASDDSDYDDDDQKALRPEVLEIIQI